MTMNAGADDQGTKSEAEIAAEAEAEAQRIAAEGETELHVAIGQEPDPDAAEDAEIEAPLEDGTPASEPIKVLRRKAREDARALRALTAERDAAIAAAAGAPKEPDAVTVGEKPTLESCEYDAAKFETELLAWNTRTNEAAAVAQRRADSQKVAQDAYAARLATYRSEGAALKVAAGAFKAAEDKVCAVGGLSLAQQSIIVRHAKSAALVIFALGNDPVKLKELGAINDPVEFAVKAAQLEMEIKTVSKPKFKPDTKPGGSGSGALATGANALEKARAEAERTGDYSKVHAINKAARDAARNK